MKNHREEKGRIDKVLRYIDGHLNQDLLLEDLAKIACYSPFHFQRVFKNIVGETPKQYIIRLRLEKAAHVIVLNPDRSMMDICLELGFKSLEAFSRAFKDYYLISPDKFRKAEEDQKLLIIQKPELRESYLHSSESFLLSTVKKEEFEDFTIQVVKRPSQKLIYLQTTLNFPETIRDGFKKIHQWAVARDLGKPGVELIGLIKDYPIFTTLDKCRYWVCMVVDDEPEDSGSFGYLELPSGKYAAFDVQGSMENVLKACAYFAHYWLPESGYKIVHEYALQLPLNDPTSTPFNDNLYKIFIKIAPQ